KAATHGTARAVARLAAVAGGAFFLRGTGMKQAHPSGPSVASQGEAQPDTRLDDFERGLANRRAVLGDACVERSLGEANTFNAEFHELITRYAWHEIWGRPGLDHTTRRLLVLAMTMAAARWEEFELHCRAALRAGVAPQLLKETLLQGAIYCGVPAANTGFKLAQQILREEGLAPAPQPLTPSQRVAVHDTFSQPQLHVA